MPHCRHDLQLYCLFPDECTAGPYSSNCVLFKDDDDDGMIVLPPEMDVTPYALTICVYKGKDLPKV